MRLHAGARSRAAHTSVPSGRAGHLGSHAGRGSLYAETFTAIKADLEAFSPGREAVHDGHGRLADGERAF